MAEDDDTSSFLTLPFDWYVLERWDASDSIEESPQRRQKHIELGIAYAALGHKGRRPYAQRAFKWRCGDRDGSNLPQSLSSVPRDLLIPTERELGFNPFWIRTNYGRGTDARFAELVRAHEDFDCFYIEIMNGERYELTDYDDRALYAFFPGLLDSPHDEYLDDYCSWDSEELQKRLFGNPESLKNGISEEDLHSSSHLHFFVADQEAMRTGFIHWVIPDQYGNALLSERVQPWSIRDLVNTLLYYTLAEFRLLISEGVYGGRGNEEDLVGPWTPPETPGLPIR